MKQKTDAAFFQNVTQKMLKNNHVKEAVLCVESGDGTLTWAGGTGRIQPDNRYFIASVTKLYITALMLILRADGKLGFHDPISGFFPPDFISGLHVLDGVDYTDQITIAHLMSNTSGIPDYFYYEQAKGEAASGLLNGMDEAWPLERAIEKAKTLKPKFIPGRKGRVFYSDTNYQLLGGIIEAVTGRRLADVFDEFLFQPLNLSNTYAYQDPNDTSPIPFYYKTKELSAPNYMASVTAEGGIVSTARECMVFLKAFFNGSFFPPEEIEELKKTWNLIVFPGQFYFGLGLEKLWTPRIISPVRPIGEILGFWGQTGAFAFFNPKTDLYFTGTVNQANGFGHSAAFNAILKIIKAM